MDEIELKVAEAMQIDYGKRVVRLDSNARRLLNLTTGDVIQIAAKKTTAALVLPAHPQDEGLNIIRMDGILRQNTNVALGDRVKVKKAEIRNAKKIVLAPNQNSRYAPGFDTYVKKNLIGKPLSKGDILSVNIFGTSFPFVVAQTVPNGLLLVAPDTEVILKEEPVKELGKVSTISYEDIGGMKDTVQKIREMIELPMRHPELFERLGIEPPKGVLIYGPPGTGKTLLARAVASESDAHFITINGPEIVCVAGDTRVTLANGTNKPIQDIFLDAKKQHGSKTDKNIEYVDLETSVMALHEDGAIRPAQSTRVLRLTAPTSYSVKTRRGLNVRASENEPFAVLNKNGAIEWVKAKDLKEGHYVAGVKKIDFPPLEKQFDLTKLHNVIAVVDGKQTDITRANAETARFSYPSRNQTRTGPIALPRTNSAAFMEFAGFMFSEGSISVRGDEVAFANQDAGLKQRFAKLAQILFDLPTERVKQYEDKAVIHSRLVTDFLVHCAGFYQGKKPGQYELPDYIKRAPEEWVAAFLGAYLDGDGGVSKQGNYPTPKFYSASPALLADLQSMLLRLGIRSKRNAFKASYGPMHELVVFGGEDRERFAKMIPLHHAAKRQAMAESHNQEKTGDTQRLPVSTALKQLKDGLRMRYGRDLPEGDFERYVSGRDMPTTRKIGAILPFIEKRLDQWHKAKEHLDNADRRAMAPCMAQPEPFATILATPAFLENARTELAAFWNTLQLQEHDVPKSLFHTAKYYLKYGAKARTAAPLLELSEGFKRVYESVQPLEETLNRLNTLVNADVYFDEVTQVEKQGELEVYDLTVEGVSNFIGNNMVLHNSKFVGEAEERLRGIFQEAEENAPTIIFIDEIDSIAPKREEVVGEVEKRIVSQLLTLMDGLKSRGSVVVIGASVTGDTPILVKDSSGVRLTPIGKFVDAFYDYGEEGAEKTIQGVQTLGFDARTSNNRFGQKYFEKSAWKKVQGVFRHRVNEVYEIAYRGGMIRATGNHSVFVRNRQGVQFKPVAELKPGEVLVDVPYKTRDGQVRAHAFPLVYAPVLLRVVPKKLVEANRLIAQGKVRQAAETAGVHVTAAYHWKNGASQNLLRTDLARTLPEEVEFTPALAKLFGYYAAEGYARRELDFCFGTHEKRLIDDLIQTMKTVFHVEPTKVRVTGSRANITYGAKILADFFVQHVGKGAHHKHAPGPLFELPREHFLEFLKGYILGDGYRAVGKKEGWGATSVSHRLILELNWLCRMHGIKTSTGTFKAKEGRTIKGGKPLRETTAYRLWIGKTNDPYAATPPSKKHVKRPIITSVTRVPFDGYVYDLCGCDNEAFFGGETPLLLHNTNRQNSIDPALRRPGRFDREIEIGVPDKKGRKEILQIHTRGMPLNKDVSLDEIAGQTHGFVGADLHALVKEGAMKALRRMLPKIDLEAEQIPAKILEELKVTREDVQNALREIQPSALREVYVEVPNVRWSDIGGLEDVKREIREAVEMPLKKPEVFKRMGIRPVRGILLYGPPGTGKTLMAKAVATESEANFISIKGPEILSKWLGESEKSVREIFRKARQAAPTVIFIDELDSIAQVRGGDFDSGVSARVVDSLLTEMDGLKNIKDVVVIGATNRIDIIDPALLRPGRFDKLIEISAPDAQTRLAILQVHTAKMPISPKIELQKIAALTEGFSGADIEGLCREAAMIALRENLAAKLVEPVHFEKALVLLSPILTKKREREKDLQYA